MVIIVFGVSGSGKTTTGQLLATQLNMPFYDADDFHPAENVKKMSAGIPLQDEDRKHWLEELAENIKEWSKGKGAVLACSALKERYRKQLNVSDNIHWVFLKGSPDLINQRINARKNHYMNPVLLNSQIADLEMPEYGITVDIIKAPHLIVRRIMDRLENRVFNFGVIGMGVMGRNLALNQAEKGTKVAIYNRHVLGSEEGIAAQVVQDNPDFHLAAFDDLKDFVTSMTSPRVILLMIPAGRPIDMQLDDLIPLLEKGDVVIDGGNSYYKDSKLRSQRLAEHGLHFLPMGVSGGEEGARKGPSMMPGGSKEGYDIAKPFLEPMAAVDKNLKPCITYVGPEGSGHFVKMVHNSIEYGEMQLLAEVYYIFRKNWGMDPIEISEVFATWRDHHLDSYLLEITINILKKKDGEHYLLDMILDQAEQKGTGGWSVGTALEYGVPYGPLVEAVMARTLSARKQFRTEMSKLIAYKPAAGFVKDENTDRVKNAYAMVSLLNHAIGFDLIQTVSKTNGWDINLSEVSRIWTNGCIIRSTLMDDLVNIFKESEDVFSSLKAVEAFGESQVDLAYTVSQSLNEGTAIPVMSSALNYYLGNITKDSPANMIQAQRDYFGAHTYRRVDADSSTYFHTDWTADHD
ncbi:NADP-dependent phosphogluconate dehydrogenase [Anditalea andensis]|uniref:6-phosphogluconate dehydrogenase, decarboxylating n=1 Tax=Anditalea andensis TaxID=1048983 RepID=A0A074KVA6_9BACT|nr:NADP-dependent phosphogluconate dehydrogenase [Anditalea andensis]KEO73916.1 6-phosphogluconate dehydrogenase [Anditalea andensis]